MGELDRGQSGLNPGGRSGFVRIDTDDGLFGLGEACPMLGGRAALGMIQNDWRPTLIGRDPLDQAVLQDTLLHKSSSSARKGVGTAALAALDIALWDIKGKALGLPIYKLLGGAWRTRMPFYASIGSNAERTVDEVVRVVEVALPRRAPGGDQDPLGRRPHRARRTTSRATSPRRARCASWSATASRSASTPITATRSAARSGSDARSRSSASSGSRSRCSIIT